MDHSINRRGNKLDSVTKENSTTTDERPHYVQTKESASLSRGHFTNKPHLTELAFSLAPSTRSPCSNPNSFLLSGCLEELWRSVERLWSEAWALGFDLWLAPAALAGLSHTDGAVPLTKRALHCGERQAGCCPAPTKEELCRGGEEQWDGLRGGGEESSVPNISILLWKPALLKDRVYGAKKLGGFSRVGDKMWVRREEMCFIPFGYALE